MTTTFIPILSPIELRPRGIQRISDHSERLDDPEGDQGSALIADYSPLFNYSGIEGPKSSLGRAIIEVTGTAVYAADMEPEGLAPVGFRNEHRIKNDPGSERTLAPAWSFVSQPGYQADGATVLLQENGVGFEQVDYWAEPHWLTLNGGVIDGTTLGAFTSKAFAAGVRLQGNVELDAWVGYEVKPPTLTERIDGYDDADGVIHNVVGHYVPRLTEGDTTNVGIRCDSPVHLWRDFATHDANDYDYVVTIGGVAEFTDDADLPYSGLSYAPVFVYTMTPDAGASPSALVNNMVVQSAEDATVRALGSLISFRDLATVKADTSDDTMNAFRSFQSEPTVGVLNGGTLTLGALTNFYAAGTVGDGVTVTARRGIKIQPVTVEAGGDVQFQYGLEIAAMTQGSLRNRAIRMEGGGGIEFASATEPAGALSSSSECVVYFHAGKIVFKYNDGGTTRYKSLDLTGTGVTWVHATSAP